MNIDIAHTEDFISIYMNMIGNIHMHGETFGWELMDIIEEAIQPGGWEKLKKEYVIVGRILTNCATRTIVDIQSIKRKELVVI